MVSLLGIAISMLNMRPADFWALCPIEYEEALFFYGKGLSTDRLRRYIDTMESMRIHTYYMLKHKLKGDPTIESFMPFPWETPIVKIIDESFTDDDANYYEKRISGKIKKRRAVN